MSELTTARRLDWFTTDELRAELARRDELARAQSEVLSTAQVAAQLGISPRGVRLAVDRERLRAVGVDKDGYLFDQGDVDRYAATRRRPTVAQGDCSPVPSATAPHVSAPCRA